MKLYPVIVREVFRQNGFKVSGAIYSRSMNHRYLLWRIWDTKKPIMTLIGLNPSTATHIKLDPTVSRCVSYAQLWGFGTLLMLNIFAYRATDPQDMRAALNPIGAQNDNYILKGCKNAKLVVAAWGNHGEFLDRGAEVVHLLKKHKIPMTCLGINANGMPKHPLYLAADVKTIPYLPIF